MSLTKTIKKTLIKRKSNIAREVVLFEILPQASLKPTADRVQTKTYLNISGLVWRHVWYPYENLDLTNLFENMIFFLKISKIRIGYYAQQQKIF